MVLDPDLLVELEARCQGDEAWSERLVRASIADADTATWLIDPGGCGYAVFSVAGEIADLQRIGVLPGRRRSGVASRLLGRALRAARERGADRMLLEVNEHNAAALALYQRHGWVEIDRRPGYYRDSGAAVVMQRGLHDVADVQDAESVEETT